MNIRAQMKSGIELMSERISASFWDEQYRNSGIHAPTDGDFWYYLDRGIEFFGGVSGKRVLDLGCGLGGNSIPLARMGASVTAIDTSEEAIDKLNHFAARESLDITGLVCDAMEISNLGTFNFVVGAMILHHLEPFGEFCASLDAAIKPAGKAFFYENNAKSRLLVWARKNLVGRFGIPKFGDDTEFPLTPHELDLLRSRFNLFVEVPEMVLFTMAGVYLFRNKGQIIFRTIDELLFRLNFLKSWSYRQILFLEKY
jgi:2-polyprenyl-3-methyl-5-hydroxy-6-metoxy-1,4-benzoquinol methylase